MSGLNLEVALPYGDYKGQAKGDVPDGDGFLQVKPDASVIKMPIGPPEEVFGGTYDGTFSVGKFSGQGVYMFPETSTLRSYKVRVEGVAVRAFAAHAWTARRDGMLWSGADLAASCALLLTQCASIPFRSRPTIRAELLWCIAGHVRGGQDARAGCARVARRRHVVHELPRRPRAHHGRGPGDVDVSVFDALERAPRLGAHEGPGWWRCTGAGSRCSLRRHPLSLRHPN